MMAQGTGRGGARPGAGRKKGTKNSVSKKLAAETISESALNMRDMQLKCMEKAEDALKTLVEVMNDDASGATARIAAAKAILERGYGAPTQTVDLTADVTVDDKPVAPIERARWIAAALAEGAVQAEQDDALH